MVTLPTQLGQLEDVQLIRRSAEEELTYLFQHALTQEAAYKTLLLKRRREIHRRIAETYEQLYPERLDELAALLAYHYAEAGDEAKTVEYAIRAGDYASRVYASVEARSHYAHALQTLDRPPDTEDKRRLQLDTLVKQVGISLFADPPPRNLTRLDQAEQLAQGLLASDPSVQKALAKIYYYDGFIHLMANEPPEALHFFRQSRTLAQAICDDQLEATAAHDSAVVLIIHGHFGEGAPLMVEAIRLSEASGKPLSDFGALGYLGGSLAARGYYAEGLKEGMRGFALAQAEGDKRGLEIHYVLLAVIYMMGGEIPNMFEASSDSAHIATANADILFLFVAFALLAWSQSRLGQHQDAFETLAKANAISEKVNGKILSRELCAAVELEVYYNAGQPDQALNRADQAIRLAQEVENLWAESIAQRVYGQALARSNPPRWDEADEHFAASLRACEEGDSRLEAARTRVAWAQVLQARGNLGAAREHFEKAAAQFQASGLTYELERTQQLMASLAA